MITPYHHIFFESVVDFTPSQSTNLMKRGIGPSIIVQLESERQ